ncbi:MAG: CRTAC1 family protein [Phycisphaeraceae bacterium]|nr:CRTAC1 family protein [Phycisphaeraceae bacterium]
MTWTGLLAILLGAQLVAPLSPVPSASMSARSAVSPSNESSGSPIATPRDEAPQPRFIEVSRQVGLSGVNAARVSVADLNGDGRPDLIVQRTEVWLLRSAPEDEPGFRFERVESGLDDPGSDGVVIFADLDGDGVLDAVASRSMGATWWQPGRGDGSFQAPREIAAARPGTVAAMAAGDIDRDGRTDVLIGRWYRAYGSSLDAFPADLLLNRAAPSGAPEFVRTALPEDDAEFTEALDAGGRPLYGVLIAEVLDRSIAPPPQLLMLAYGRRWNRLYVGSTEGWRDEAPALGLDGDAERSGAYPEWLRERARTDPRFDRKDELPFRANGNTFDAAIGDLDGDGAFDLVIAEITHAWAGPSSDRTRTLLQLGGRFVAEPEWCLDRIPPNDSPDARRWNQGDLFVEVADLDLDGRLDVILASGDYPDPPPFDERLRIFMQVDVDEGAESPRRLIDRTAELGIDHPGCGQIAWADFDGDGRIDLVAGQSFTRFTPEMIAAAGGTPQLRIFLNRASSSNEMTTESSAKSASPPSDGGANEHRELDRSAPGSALPSPRTIDPSALIVRLKGDPSLGIATTPHGAIVEVRQVRGDGREHLQKRQLAGPGGHAGKQSEALIVFGLEPDRPLQLRVTWPSTPPRQDAWIAIESAGQSITISPDPP